MISINRVRVAESQDALDLNKFRWRESVAELRETVALAKLRCASPEHVLHRLCARWHCDDRNVIIKRLREMPLGPAERNQLARILDSVLRVTEGADEHAKTRAESTTRQLATLLTPRQAGPLVARCLVSRRKSRRAIAYRLLRDKGPSAHTAKVLLRLSCNSRDQDVLKLFARFPAHLPQDHVLRVLRDLEDEYWRARIFEWLLKNDTQVAYDLAPEFPKPFMWGLGRAKCGDDPSVRRSLFQSNKHSFEFVSLFAWSLGQIADLAGLRTLLCRIPSLQQHGGS